MLSLKDFKEHRAFNISKLIGGKKDTPGGSHTGTTATGCTYTRTWDSDYTDADGGQRLRNHKITWGEGCCVEQNGE